jgi:hypothetical protein
MAMRMGGSCGTADCASKGNEALDEANARQASTVRRATEKAEFMKSCKELERGKIMLPPPAHREATWAAH